MRNFILVVGVLMLVVFSGCASILSGTTERVNILSNPPGLVVTIDNGIQVRTPALVVLASNSPHVFTATMEGEIRTGTIETYLTPVTYLNFIFSPIIGTMIDILTGASIQLETNRIMLDFTSPQED